MIAQPQLEQKSKKFHDGNGERMRGRHAINHELSRNATLCGIGLNQTLCGTDEENTGGKINCRGSGESAIGERTCSGAGRTSRLLGRNYRLMTSSESHFFGTFPRRRGSKRPPVVYLLTGSDSPEWLRRGFVEELQGRTRRVGEGFLSFLRPLTNTAAIPFSLWSRAFR